MGKWLNGSTTLWYLSRVQGKSATTADRKEGEKVLGLETVHKFTTRPVGSRYHHQTSRSGKHCFAPRTRFADCPNSAKKAMIERHIPKILEKSSLALRHATGKSFPATSSLEVKQNFHRPNILHNPISSHRTVSSHERAPSQNFIAPNRFSACLSESGVAPHGPKKGSTYKLQVHDKICFELYA